MSKLEMLKRMVKAEEARDRLADMLSEERQKTETLKFAFNECIALLSEALNSTMDTE